MPIARRFHGASYERMLYMCTCNIHTYRVIEVMCTSPRLMLYYQYDRETANYYYFIYTVTHLAITRSSLTPFLLSVVHRWLLLLHDTRSLAKMRIIRSPRYDTSDAALPKTRLVAITRTVFAQIEKRHSRRALFSYYRSNSLPLLRT